MWMRSTQVYGLYISENITRGKRTCRRCQQDIKRNTSCIELSHTDGRYPKTSSFHRACWIDEKREIIKRLREGV